MKETYGMEQNVVPFKCGVLEDKTRTTNIYLNVCIACIDIIALLVTYVI